MKIIINADDFGMTKSINNAIFELMELGTLTSTTVMVNMPYAEEAVKLLDYPDCSVGLHLNLTEGKPISNPGEIATLVDKDGRFLGKKKFEEKAKKNELNKKEIYIELNSQYKKLKSILGDQITHLDSHQWLNRVPIVFSVVKNFGKQNNIKGIRIYVKYYLDNVNGVGHIQEPRFTSVSKFGIKRILIETYLKWKRFQINNIYDSPDGILYSKNHDTVEVLKLLSKSDFKLKKDNKTFEIPCHPAVDTVELEDTELVEDRIREYEILKSEDFVKASNRLNLVSYKSIIN